MRSNSIQVLQGPTTGMPFSPNRAASRADEAHISKLHERLGENGIPVVGPCKTWIELDRTLVLLFRTHPVPFGFFERLTPGGRQPRKDQPPLASQQHSLFSD